MGMSLSKLWEMVKDRGAWRAAVHGGRKELDTTETEQQLNLHDLPGPPGTKRPHYQEDALGRTRGKSQIAPVHHQKGESLAPFLEVVTCTSVSGS